MDASEAHVSPKGRLAPDLNKSLDSSADSFELEISIRGNGVGTVKRMPERTTYSKDEVVRLKAEPGAGSRFVRWMNDATGTEPVCSVTMTKARWLFAEFELLEDRRPTDLTADRVSEKRVGHLSTFIDHGDGTVTDTRTRLMWMRCALGQSWNGSTCIGHASYHRLAGLTLSSSFNGHDDWRLPTLDELKTLINPKQAASIIDTEVFPNAPESYFWTSSPESEDDRNVWQVDFSSGCIYSNRRTVRAYIRLVRNTRRFTLSVTTTGMGNGTVGRSVYAIDHLSGSTVTLTARASEGSKFKCWEGDATGQDATCTVTLDSEKFVSAEFVALKSYPLNVSITGTGRGLIDRSINSPSYFADTEITLTALAEEGSIFNGWHGDVEMMDETITVTMKDAYSINAEFVALESFVLDVTATGTGRGRIYRNIDLPSYYADTKVTLTALAEGGSIFNGWHGDVNMMDDAIIVTMRSAYSIGAEFVQLDIADTEITAELISISRQEIKRDHYGIVFKLKLRNIGDQQVRIKVPLTRYVSKNGQTSEQSAWTAGLVNGSKGVTLSAGTYCEMGLVHFVEKPLKGDRLFVHVEQVKPSARMSFTFQCTGDDGATYRPTFNFLLINASEDRLGEATVLKAPPAELARALKRIESLESTLAEVLCRLDAIQQSLPMGGRNSPSTQTCPAQTLPEVLAWLAKHEQISVAELRARLLPLDLLPGAVIDELNERALDLTGELALEEVDDLILVTRETLLEVLANEEAGPT